MGSQPQPVLRLPVRLMAGQRLGATALPEAATLCHLHKGKGSSFAFLTRPTLPQALSPDCPPPWQPALSLALAAP